MLNELVRFLTSNGRGQRPARQRRASLRLEWLEDRCTPTVVATSNHQNLTITSNAADVVYILETAPATFKVGTSASDAASSQTSYSNLKNITVNLTGSGALVYVAGLMNPPDAPDAPGISGSFTVNASSGSTLAVEVHDGFTVAGKVNISAAGATFQSHYTTELPGDMTTTDQVVDGLFIDPNRRGSFGSIQISGGGTVGLDGVRAIGNVSVNLGNAAGSAFVIDREWVNREDPDSPPWTKFQQDPTSIGGNLTVTGGQNVEVYNTNVAGNASITESSTSATDSYRALLGNDSIGHDLTITTPGGSKSGVFVDFSTVGRNTSISQSSDLNFLGIQSSFFSGRTTLSQGGGTAYLFIDSEALLQATATSVLGGLPSDSGYLGHLQNAHLLPPDFGSRFLKAVTSTQGGSTNQLDIGQDSVALSSFATASTFTAAPGSNSHDVVSTTSIPPTFNGYTPLPSP